MGKRWKAFTRGASPALVFSGTAFLVMFFVGGPLAALATYLDSLLLLILADAVILAGVFVSVYGLLFRSWGRE